MWIVLGPSVLAGILLLTVLVPLNGFYVASWVRKLQVSLTSATLTNDEYIHLMHVEISLYIHSAFLGRAGAGTSKDFALGTIEIMSPPPTPK